MGGKARRPHSKKEQRMMDKEVSKGEKQIDYQDYGFSPEEVKEQKRLLSKMSLKEKKPEFKSAQSKEKKSKKTTSPYKHGKRTTPGEVKLGEGPTIAHLNNEKWSQSREKKILENKQRLNKKLDHQTNPHRKKR